jgi:hypothetical protein
LRKLSRLEETSSPGNLSSCSSAEAIVAVFEGKNAEIMDRSEHGPLLAAVEVDAMINDEQ